jgi:hypothetical protein
MRTNVEQFEVLVHSVGSDEAEAHELRLARLAANAIPLEQAEGSAAWRRWESDQRERDRLSRELARLDRRLAESAAVGRRADTELLSNDLQRLYADTVAARLRKPNGDLYLPNRFRDQVTIVSHDPAMAVPVLTSLLRRQTEGLDVILHNDRPELAAEILAVDPTKPYYTLIPQQRREAALRRLEQFPSWIGLPLIARTRA